jgi:hypothetical protein
MQGLKVFSFKIVNFSKTNWVLQMLDKFPFLIPPCLHNNVMGVMTPIPQIT